MRLFKSARLALNILLHSKLRSWLTIIGIVIGVAAVVAIVSIGEGLQQSIQSRLGGLGADIITVAPGGGRASGGFRGGFGPPESRQAASSQTGSSTTKNLTKRDIQVLRAIEGVKLVHGVLSGRAEAYYLTEQATVSIDGIDALAWSQITTSVIESGRFLGPADTAAVIVGNRIAKNTFKQPLALNRDLTIEGRAFKIVGILKEGGFSGDDNKVIMLISAARETIPDVGQEEFSSIYVKADEVDDIDTVLADADAKLMISRHLTNKTKDYRITSAKAQQEQVASITQTLTLFLGAIAAVSLLVGAVGIANTMFTSVLEKTKEIGIMKAIGAKNSDILLIFVFNAAMVGMVGGLLGIGLGALTSALLPQIGIRLMTPGSSGGLVTAISLELLAVALLLAIAIGVLAGAIPAYRASRLKPADSLRYE